MPRTAELKAYCYCEFEGAQVDTFTVRGYKGKDRKLFSEYKNNINQFIVEFVASCIVAVNGKPIDNLERKRLMVKRMERGDIFNAFYTIRKVTKNDPTIIIQGLCRRCGIFETEYNSDQLDRIENKDQEIRFELPEGLELERNGNTEIHKDIVIKKPTGQTLIDMGNIENEFEAVQRGVASCIVRIGEKDNVSYYDLDELSGLDTAAIEEAWSRELGGLATRITVSCPQCRKSCETEILIQDFFV